MDKQQQEVFNEYSALDTLSTNKLIQKIKETISQYEIYYELKYLKTIEMICDILKSRIVN